MLKDVAQRFKADFKVNSSSFVFRRALSLSSPHTSFFFLLGEFDLISFLSPFQQMWNAAMQDMDEQASTIAQVSANGVAEHSALSYQASAQHAVCEVLSTLHLARHNFTFLNVILFLYLHFQAHLSEVSAHSASLLEQKAETLKRGMTVTTSFNFHRNV
jgi:hypothetical protein